MFQHTKSHGLVFLQFLGVLCLIFDDKEIKRIKNALTEFYKNLSYTTLSDAQNFEFDPISELVRRISFLIKGSTLLDRDKSELEDAQIAAKKIVQKYENISRKEAALPFNINNIADAETIDFNNDTDIYDVSSSKMA